MSSENKRVIRARIRSAPSDNEYSTETVTKLQSFLKKFNHHLVAQRKKAAIDRCVEHGRILLCERIDPQNAINNLAGCSLQYDLCDQKYVEIGSIRIPGKAGLGGFELQSVLISVASCQLFLTKALGEDGYAPKNFFATIAPENLSVQGPKFKTLGMVPWENPPLDLVEAKSSTVMLGAEHPMFFDIPLDGVADHAKYLIELYDRNFQLTRMGLDQVEEVLEIDFDLFLFRRLIEPLRELATQSTYSISEKISELKA